MNTTETIHKAVQTPLTKELQIAKEIIVHAKNQAKSIEQLALQKMQLFENEYRELFLEKCLNLETQLQTVYAEVFNNFEEFILDLGFFTAEKILGFELNDKDSYKKFLLSHLASAINELTTGQTSPETSPTKIKVLISSEDEPLVRNYLSGSQNINNLEDEVHAQYNQNYNTTLKPLNFNLNYQINPELLPGEFQIRTSSSELKFSVQDLVKPHQRNKEQKSQQITTVRQLEEAR